MKTGDAWTTVRSAAPDTLLPGLGVRIQPSQAPLLARLPLCRPRRARTIGSSAISNSRPIRTASATSFRSAMLEPRQCAGGILDGHRHRLYGHRRPGHGRRGADVGGHGLVGQEPVRVEERPQRRHRGERLREPLEGIAARYAIVLTPSNSQGTCSWCVVEHVRFERNVVRNVAAGINLLGCDNGSRAAGRRHRVPPKRLQHIDHARRQRLVPADRRCPARRRRRTQHHRQQRQRRDLCPRGTSTDPRKSSGS